jgi:hypothetical protein
MLFRKEGILILLYIGLENGSLFFNSNKWKSQLALKQTKVCLNSRQKVADK